MPEAEHSDGGTPRVLTSGRLTIRPVAMGDLEACHRLYVDIGWADKDATDAHNRETRKRWLQWSVLNDEQLALLHQPPYGDRAVVLREDGRFIGLAGLVPLLAPFGQLPSFGSAPGARFSAEVGLFWAISPSMQRKGYATEAGRALLDLAFGPLRLGRIIAGTERTNAASIAVMRRLGMRIEQNPFLDPPWFEVSGILEAG